ncbi:glutamine-hydrolyzing carbamoyl-phosphate synthase small subunit [Candidatus Daviesbacteria bacterium]|nr:glutamine-hydrolyzing carbamoyl-phosphate synthase small subunit [Candidatus Daviesbacteria bacterium]
MMGKLILSDGTVESLTDPSYFGQILVLTYPLQGNYGVPERKFWESDKIQVKGLIVQNYIDNPSHFESKKTLGGWLKEEGIPALSGIDTRQLTIKLREHGVMLGRIELSSKNKQSLQSSDFKELSIYDPNTENLLPYVSCKEIKVYGTGPSTSLRINKKKNIVLIDCGAKENIVGSLVRRGVKVTCVPWDFDPATAGFDGVLISNGPGDPKKADKTIANVRKLLEKNIPTFGICLGSQILALAAGGETYKLKFGHRGQNQPVMDKTSGRAIITSQNHGFAVDMKSLSKDWEEWFVNLNDGTNEGIRHKSKPFMAMQFHPEASPGPVDAGYLFDKFLSQI